MAGWDFDRDWRGMEGPQDEAGGLKEGNAGGVSFGVVVGGGWEGVVDGVESTSMGVSVGSAAVGSESAVTSTEAGAIPMTVKP